MTRDEAKTILHACRSGLRDAQDPRIAEALAFAEHDPEMRAWFDESQQFDALIAGKLKSAPLPDDLLERVRAGAAARVGSRKRRSVMPLALAASLAILGLIVGLIWLGRGSSVSQGPFASCRSDMARFLREFPKLDLETDRLADVREWLHGKPSLAQAKLPTGLEPFPSLGCRTVKWRNHQLSLVCFMVDGQVVHLFVIPRSEFPNASFANGPQYAKAGQFNTAAWSRENTIYLALTEADSGFLRRLL